MTGQIGFLASVGKEDGQEVTAAETRTGEPRRSLVQVRFPGRPPLAYYNDRFDLHKGDLVYVEGKLEGVLGLVTNVAYNFKFKASDYKRVIYLVDTEVHGRFFNAGSHLVAFDRQTIPYAQVLSWLRAPEDEEEYISGEDDSAFRLDDLTTMGVTNAIAERGHNYYMENRVRYLSLDGERGRAIVQGSEVYEVEFRYRDGEISGLICSCFCSYPCKHGFASMLQLRESLEYVLKHHGQDYEKTGFFAAVEKAMLLHFALDSKPGGSMVL